MKNNKKILVVKMAAPNASSSSMIRTLAVIKGFVENGYEVDLFCIHANSNIVLKDLSGYGFMEQVNIIYADEEKNGGANQAVYGMLSGSKGGIKHKLFFFYKFFFTDISN